MNSRILIIALVVVVLVIVFIFFFGYSLGTVSGNSTSKNAVQSQVQTQKMPEAINVLSSKVIPSIAAYGIVTKIDGRNITLTYQTDSIVITMRSDAKIYSYVVNSALVKPGSKPPANAYVTKLADFNDIKVNQNLSANIKVYPDGRVEGFSAIFLPPNSIPIK